MRMREPVRKRIRGWMVLGILATVGIGQARAQNEGEQEAPALGMRYVLVPYGQSMGARLTQYPSAGSPLAALQFEPGDMIVSLDELAINSPQDVLNHVGRTTMVFINIRTGQAQSAVVELPAQVIQPGGAAPAPLDDAMSQPMLRHVASTMLRGGEVDYKPLVLKDTGPAIKWTLPVVEIDGPVSMPLREQFGVEVIRLTRSQPHQQSFWEPYLQRIEAVIAEAARDPATADPEDFGAGFEYSDRIHSIYDQAMQDNAGRIGKVAEEEPPAVQTPIYEITLLTANNQGLVYLMPRAPFRIKQLSHNNQAPGLNEFEAYTPGEPATLLGGRYVYKVVYENGAQFPAGNVGTILVNQPGRIRLQ
jgi:hypothetical protein